MSSEKVIKRFKSGILFLVLATLNIQCQENTKPPAGKSLQVDFDFSERRIGEVHHEKYESWLIESGSGTEKEFEEVRIDSKEILLQAGIKLEFESLKMEN